MQHYSTPPMRKTDFNQFLQYFCPIRVIYTVGFHCTTIYALIKTRDIELNDLNHSHFIPFIMYPRTEPVGSLCQVIQFSF